MLVYNNDSGVGQLIDQEEIHGQCLGENPKERIKTLEQLGSGFSLLADRQQAWDDLIKLTGDKRFDKKSRAVFTLGSVFPQVPDKQKAWSDLVKLTTDKDDYVRCEAVDTLNSVFFYVPDKKRAWKDLVILTDNEDRDVREKAACAIISVFSEVSDRQQVWDDLVKITTNKYRYVRSRAADALGSAFSNAPDKDKAWNDLHKLTTDEHGDIRGRVADALVSASIHSADKENVWNDLHRLTTDKDIFVRTRAAYAIGSAYSQLPNKQQAWEDLLRLSMSESGNLRAQANHSLGRISILKASQTEEEEDYRKGLEMAIEFYEKVMQESKHTTHSQFCLPLYRTFHSIIFEKQEAKEEVNKYLTEAKNAVRGSKSKKILFEIVENLANALREVHNLENTDLRAMQGKLNFYIKYCDRAAELMEETEESAPYATAAMKKGLPLLDKKLRGLFEEIQEKAKISCQESRGTPAQEIACTVNSEIQQWEIGSQEEMSWYVENLALVLKSKIPYHPKNDGIIDMINSMRCERDLTKQYRSLSSIIGLIPTLNVVPIEPVIEKIEKIENSQREMLEGVRKTGEKLDNIVVYMKPGIHEEFILHIGTLTSAGGAEYTLSIPLQGLSSSEIREDLKEIADKRVCQLSMLPKRVAEIVEGYLVKNKMEDLLNKLY